MKRKMMTKTISAVLALVMLFMLPVNIHAQGNLSIDTEPTIMGENVISDTLKEIEENNPQEQYRVMIWLDDIDTTPAVEAAMKSIHDNYAERYAYLTDTATVLTEQEGAELDRYIAAERAAKKSCYEPYTADFASRYINSSEIIYSSKYLPIIIADMSYDRIEVLSKKIGVRLIDYYCDEVEDSQDNMRLSESVEMSYALATAQNYTIDQQIAYMNIGVFEDQWRTTGYGRKIGVIDNGNPDASRYSGINITYHFPNATVKSHATRIMDIITAIAPGATYYYTTYQEDGNIFSFPTLTTEMEWLIDNGVNVVNISLDIRMGLAGTMDSYNTYSSVARYLDQIIYEYGISIVKSAGNEGASGVTSGGMSYNSLVIGSYNRYDNCIDEHSSFNDGLIEGTVSKPDISAPGYFQFTYADDNTGSYYANGTSYAAAMVTGVVALLMSCRGTFCEYPERVKAVLTASTFLSHSYVPGDTGYIHFGAGVINAEYISDIAADMSYHDDTIGAAISRGEYREEFEAQKEMRISMAFLKCIANNEEYNIANLDIEIYDPQGRLIQSSQTGSNNVEIIEFTTTTAGYYHIYIVQQTPAVNGSNRIGTPQAIAILQY